MYNKVKQMKNFEVESKRWVRAELSVLTLIFWINMCFFILLKEIKYVHFSLTPFSTID